MVLGSFSGTLEIDFHLLMTKTWSSAIDLCFLGAFVRWISGQADRQTALWLRQVDRSASQSRMCRFIWQNVTCTANKFAIPICGRAISSQHQVEFIIAASDNDFSLLTHPLVVVAAAASPVLKSLTEVATRRSGFYCTQTHQAKLTSLNDEARWSRLWSLDCCCCSTLPKNWLTDWLFPASTGGFLWPVSWQDGATDDDNLWCSSDGEDETDTIP